MCKDNPVICCSCLRVEGVFGWDKGVVSVKLVMG